MRYLAGCCEYVMDLVLQRCYTAGWAPMQTTISAAGMLPWRGLHYEPRGSTTLFASANLKDVCYNAGQLKYFVWRACRPWLTC